MSHNERGLYRKIIFNPNETLGHSEDQQLSFDFLPAILLALANIIHLLNELRHDNNEDNKIQKADHNKIWTTKDQTIQANVPLSVYNGTVVEPFT